MNSFHLTCKRGISTLALCLAIFFSFGMGEWEPVPLPQRDKLLLKNGIVLRGKIVSETEELVVIERGLEEIEVEKSEIKLIKRAEEPPEKPPPLDIATKAIEARLLLTREKELNPRIVSREIAEIEQVDIGPSEVDKKYEPRGNIVRVPHRERNKNRSMVGILTGVSTTSGDNTPFTLGIDVATQLTEHISIGAYFFGFRLLEDVNSQLGLFYGLDAHYWRIDYTPIYAGVRVGARTASASGVDFSITQFAFGPVVGAEFGNPYITFGVDAGLLFVLASTTQQIPIPSDTSFHAFGTLRFRY